VNIIVFLFFFVALFVTNITYMYAKPELCSHPPKWSVNSRNYASSFADTYPMKESLGNVTLVALLKAS